ncbi:hypothetical protein [Gelidibacter japonicus]|uniref:hypothetical protein n=1 Tax=Gelidibacter japonicus TaxID=1962232 RepID=UPI003A8FE719
MKKDPYTGEKFLPKRSNQRFANPKNRKKYHNDKANRLRKTTEFVNKPLRLNRKILDYLMEGMVKKTFHQEFLRGSGYDFDIFNGTCIVNNETGFCLYNYILIFEKPNVHVYRENRP